MGVQDDKLEIDESKLPEVTHISVWAKLKIKILSLFGTWNSLPPKTKKKRLLFTLGALIVGIGVVVGVMVLAKKTVDNKSVDVSVEGQTDIKTLGDVEIPDPSEPKDEQAPLSGVMITKTQLEKIEKRRPLAVVIENHPDARPQSGLDQADVVFETLVEGGITRFVAIYHTNEPEVVGPVRSLRKYFLDMVGGFGDPVIMHIGFAESSNPDANAIGYLRLIGAKSLGFTNSAYWRVSDRIAPHNAYSSTKKLWELASAKGWTGFKDTDLWSFKERNKDYESVDNPTIRINWIGNDSTWNVKWQFDKSTGLYKRFHRDEPHKDAVTKKQLTASNIIVLYTSQAPADDGTARITVDANGNGKALVFRDGKVISGTWSKPNRTSQYHFKDKSDREIILNAGTTWIDLVPLNAQVTY